MSDQIFADLPAISVRVMQAHVDRFDDPTDDSVLFRVEQDLQPYKVAGMVPVTREMWEDLPAGSLLGLVEHALDQVFRPWRYPDRNPFPTLDLFPRLTAIGTVVRRHIRRR